METPTTLICAPLAAEIALITDPDLRRFTELGLIVAPAYFWTIAASTTGKYHPPDSLGQGGLVRHTRKVVYFAREFARGMECTPWLNELTAAALLHDLYKNGDNPDDRSRGMAHWSAHGLHACRYLENRVLEGTPGVVLASRPKIRDSVLKVFDLMSRHMGPFGGNAPRPCTREDWVLYMADYTASRKFVNVDWNLIS